MPRNRNERIGKLDRRITIQSYTETKNNFGEKEIAWEDEATVWASITYANKGTGEDMAAKRETAMTTVLFTIRFNSAYKDKKKRLSYDSQIYDIISVKEEGRRRFLIIEAQLKE